MTFRGWPAEALEFFERLEADNTKSFWQRNKESYETHVRAPMEELLEELEPEFGEGRILRPNRDIRFSPDKSPYKTHIAAAIGEGYVYLDANGLVAGSGIWEMSPEQLDRYRRAVDDERSGGELADVVAQARANRVDVEGHGTLKAAPRGYAKGHPRIELLRHKGLIALKRWPAGPWLGTAKAKDRVAESLRLSEPLTRWLRNHVGASTMREQRRSQP